MPRGKNLASFTCLTCATEGLTRLAFKEHKRMHTREMYKTVLEAANTKTPFRQERLKAKSKLRTKKAVVLIKKNSSSSAVENHNVVEESCMDSTDDSRNLIETNVESTDEEDSPFDEDVSSDGSDLDYIMSVNSEELESEQEHEDRNDNMKKKL